MQLDSGPGEITIDLYPVENYLVGQKQARLEKDTSVNARMDRMKENYKKHGLRRHVEGIILVHNHGHPHVLLLQIGSAYFKLPGGRLRQGEGEFEGLRRKLTNKLSPTEENYQLDWQVGDLFATWWRPNFETVMYPYMPAHLTKPKEIRKQFLVPLPERCILAIPKNLKLLAVPLFELYDNPHRYGPAIASLPQVLGRVNFVCHD